MKLANHLNIFLLSLLLALKLLISAWIEPVIEYLWVAEDLR